MPRTPQDIDGFLRRIGEVWKRCPQLRLGQILVNTYGTSDLFYTSDENLVTGIEQCAEKMIPLKTTEG